MRTLQSLTCHALDSHVFVVVFLMVKAAGASELGGKRRPLALLSARYHLALDITLRSASLRKFVWVAVGLAPQD